jgi:hypothetical protein
MSFENQYFGERNIDMSLRLALREGDGAKVIQALAKGADANAAMMGGDFDYRPLPRSCDQYKSGQTEQGLAAITALLEAGAKLEARSAFGATALHHAAQSGWPGAVQILLDAGAAPMAVDQDGQTPLHCAAMERAGRELSVEAVETLLRAGADVDARTSLGITPLHCACASGHVPVMRALLAAGADPAARASDGRSAMDFLSEARFADESEKKRGLDLLTQALAQTGRVAPSATKATKSASAAKKKELRWSVERWMRDKSSSSHDFLRSQGNAVVTPGGQEGLSIDALSVLEMPEHGEFALALVEHFNKSALGQGIKALGMEPGVPGLALPWLTSRSEGGMWQEVDVNEQNFAFIAPLRGVDEQGQDVSFLLMSTCCYDVNKKSALKSLPSFSKLGRVSWSMALDAKQAQKIAVNHRVLHALVQEADRSWGLEWLLNPARLESEALDQAALGGASRPRATL